MSTVIKPAVFQRNIGAQSTAISEKLAQFAASFDIERVPNDVVYLAKLHLLDSFGIALASTTREFGQRALMAARGLAGDGPSPVIGMSARLPMRDAAMVNGTLIHGLAFDDTYTSGIFHASSSAVPTMLAVALAQRKSGRDALAAYLVGIETGTRIAKAAGGSFHVAGFHPTSVVGTYACAMIAGRLMDLNKQQLTHAQGLAHSMAGGMREYHTDGASSKRVHPGLAAANGITSAAWAKHGFTGPRTCYEGKYGLYNCMTDQTEPDVEACSHGLGEEWEIINVGFKPYPACNWNDAFIDCALALREEHNLTPDDIESVTAYVHKDQMAICEPENSKRRPQNSYSSQFSIHYTIAAALTRGRFTLSEIQPAAFLDSGIATLSDRVSYEITDGTLFPEYFSGAILIRTTDGRELTHSQQYNRGSDLSPISATQVAEKFEDNARRAVSERRAKRIRKAIMGLETAEDLLDLDSAICLAAD